MLVSDDCLVLRAEHGGWIALPLSRSPLAINGRRASAGRHAHRGCAHHYTNKCRVSDTNLLPFANGPAPMRKLFILAYFNFPFPSEDFHRGGHSLLWWNSPTISTSRTQHFSEASSRRWDS